MGGWEGEKEKTISNAWYRAWYTGIAQEIFIKWNDECD